MMRKKDALFHYFFPQSAIYYAALFHIKKQTNFRQNQFSGMQTNIRPYLNAIRAERHMNLEYYCNSFVIRVSFFYTIFSKLAKSIKVFPV